MSIKEQVRQLWKQCFNDSDEFIELYFRMRYTDNINSYIEEDGKVIAALQRIPYPVTCGGVVLPVGYISGACTHPAYRNRGIMSRLLAEVHRQMYEEGKVLSMLIPAEEWLKGYYARSGYTVCFQQERKLLTASMLPVHNLLPSFKIKEIDLSVKIAQEVFLFFDKCQHESRCGVLHTAEDLQVILADLKLSGGSLWSGFCNGKLEALCLCLMQDGKLWVKELLTKSEEVEQAMLTHLFQYYRVETLSLVSPPENHPHDLGMARLLNVEVMLSYFSASHQGVYIQVEGDEAIPENNGFYNLGDGLCVRGYREDKSYQLFTIEELTRFVFAGQHPYMNLMLD